jgi:hypothetical protein
VVGDGRVVVRDHAATRLRRGLVGQGIGDRDGARALAVVRDEDRRRAAAARRSPASRRPGVPAFDFEGEGARDTPVRGRIFVRGTRAYVVTVDSAGADDVFDELLQSFTLDAE